MPLLLVALLGAARSAEAQGFFEQSPGPLTASHEHLSGQAKCTSCHTSGKALSPEKCLGCHDHEKLRLRIEAQKGFHASDKVKGKPCWLCHTEHKGREHEVMGWPKLGGREKFDHRWTGWPLEGAHARTDCGACHKRKNRFGVPLYLGEQTDCTSCHQKDNPHGRARAPDADRCVRCHDERAWKPALAKLAFDHNDPKQARYALLGAHASVACGKCHLAPEAQQKKAPVWKVAKDFSDCKSCHTGDEPQTHKGHLFETKRCDLCHHEKHKWADFTFDHAKHTKFPLEGKHARVDCYTCHRPKLTTKPERTCESAACHAKDDKHKNRFTREFPACSTCHTAVQWKPATTFDHDKTRFHLSGKHAQTACRSCHRGAKPWEFERFAPDIQCMQCHKHENVHEKKFTNTQCLSCHKTSGERGSKSSAENKFHGPDSTFPLDGGHAGVKCIKCHPKPTPDADNVWKVSKQCGPACHADKLHQGTLGNDCLRCHAGGVWKASAFDHDKDSDYPLVGFHRKVECVKCHPHRLYKPIARDCFSCHKKDDAHTGALGTACERCHEPSGKSLFNHQTQSRFPLDGKHTRVACNLCHPSVQLKPVPLDCNGCHKKDDVHKGAYGLRCERCHNTSGWPSVKAFHDVGAFRLTGAHDHIPCARCHGAELRALAGTGDLCITCHRQDDIHHNSLGPRCGDCHTQWAFAPSTFLHERTGCMLRGVHRTLPCLDCHRGGNYMALSPTCVSCHRKDAVTKDLAHQGYMQCALCHNANFWIPQTGAHAQRIESVCR